MASVKINTDISFILIAVELELRTTDSPKKSSFNEANISATDSLHMSSDDALLSTIQFTCEHILMPIICCLGICGNVLSLCVLTRRGMKGATMSFLRALAVSDLLLLTLQIPVFFGINADVALLSSFKSFYRFYTLIKYGMANFFITCTSWLTVAVAIERLISLRFMLRYKQLFTVRKVRSALVGIFLLSFVFHFSKFFEYVPNPDHNSTQVLLPTSLILTPAYDTYVHVANIIIAVIIPVFLLAVADSFLIYFLVIHKRHMMHHKDSTSSNKNSLDILHISVIVVATVLVFITCHSVGVFLVMTIASKGRQWIMKRPLYIGLNYINNVLVVFNSSVNFILYSAISRKFRKTLCKMCRRQK